VQPALPQSVAPVRESQEHQPERARGPRPPPGLIARVTGEDSFIPLGPAGNMALLDEPTIEKAAAGLLHAG
jgi:hypothetical protein